MRVAGALTIIVGWVAAAVLLLLPVGGSVLGTTYDCGVPILSALSRGGGTDYTSELDVAVARDCHSRSVQRVVLGGAVWFIATLGGTILVVVPQRRS